MIQSVGSFSPVQYPSQRAGPRPSAKEVFSRLDSNGDGSLDVSELQTMLDELAKKTQAMTATGTTAAIAPTAASLLSKLDTDGDGKISAAEFAAGRPHGAHRGRGAGGPPSAAEVFAKSDTDGNGSLDSTELEKLLEQLTSATGPQSQTADQLLSRLDTNGDGVVSQAEFAAGQPQGPPSGAAPNGAGGPGGASPSTYSSSADLSQGLYRAILNITA